MPDYDDYRRQAVFAQLAASSTKLIEFIAERARNPQERFEKRVRSQGAPQNLSDHGQLMLGIDTSREPHNSALGYSAPCHTGSSMPAGTMQTSMSEVFDDVCADLRLANREDRLRDIIAYEVIECVKRGGRDHAAIKICVRKALSLPGQVTRRTSDIDLLRESVLRRFDSWTELHSKTFVPCV